MFFFDRATLPIFNFMFFDILFDFILDLRLVSPVQIKLSIGPFPNRSGHFRSLNPIFYAYFSCAVSLRKTIINYCYWQYDIAHFIFWLRLNHKIPDMFQFLWFSLSKNICVYFLNKTISSQIASNNC